MNIGYFIMEHLLENKTFSEIEEGDKASITRILTKNDIRLFAIMSGDVNPAHLDEEFASSDIFKKIIAHGMWGGTLISTVLGTMLPGPGTIYLGQTLKFSKPVSIGDAVTVTLTVKSKNPEKKIVILGCSCTNQDGKEVISGESTVIAPTEKIRRKVVTLPKIEFIEDKIDAYYEQLLEITENFKPIRAAVAHPVDRSSLEAAVLSGKDGVIVPILIGPRAKIESVAAEFQIDLKGVTIISTEHSHASAETAVKMVLDGQADCIIKGSLHTDELMHPVVRDLRTERKISHIFLVLTPSYPKPLMITDAAINIMPDLMAKRDIVQNAIDLFTSLYSRAPKVAILSAVETVTEKLPATLDATALCKMAERGQIIGGILDGPLAFDNAISAEAAKIKGIVSQVSGDVDIIIVPNIEAGNILYKQMSYMSHTQGAGIVLGAKVPIVLTSRSEENLMSRKLSTILALIYANKKTVLGNPLKVAEIHH